MSIILSTEEMKKNLVVKTVRITLRRLLIYKNFTGRFPGLCVRFSMATWDGSVGMVQI